MAQAEIKPALTPEKWASIMTKEWPIHVDFARFVGGANPHALAAVCLYKRPGGFTRLDVDRHREQAEFRLRLAIEDPLYANAHEEYADWHESMAARIEALLPPNGG